MPVNYTRANEEIQQQRLKLLSSYNALLGEFSSKELTTVGNYTLGRLIGKGSFGKVYLAKHKLTNGSKVVLKSAKKNDANLAREIHHHRQFLHPHIARLYEVIVTENLVWLVLEYCPGKMIESRVLNDCTDTLRMLGDELYSYLARHGPIAPRKVQKIFTQLVGAVSYVHKQSCVHRDLKLENILLDKHGSVKLCDFGFTREYEGKASYLQTWCGTVCYSAPEMLKGEKYAGEKVDVWSLGIILYALLCGELPFDEEDEVATKMQILKEEPKYPDHLPPTPKDLIISLLSKRPLLRPSLADILANPWLAEHAPQQHAILKLQQPAPFTTQLEKDTLQRMRSAGVDIDQMIENVLAQRCDGLAGWWALLIEKEERKEKRRQQKRREKEVEAKSLRRLSGTDSRIDRFTPTIKETEEEGQHSPALRETSRSRGRNPTRTSSIDAIPESPRAPDVLVEGPREYSVPSPSFHKGGGRSASSSRHRPPVPLKDRRRSRSSVVLVTAVNPPSQEPGAVNGKRKRKYQQPFMNQLASIKQWFKESAKRAKSPTSKVHPPLAQQGAPSQLHNDVRRISTGPTNAQYATTQRPGLYSRSTFPQRPRVSTTGSAASAASSKRPSVSPSPLTPHSSYRRTTCLRGRKSTSSSVSSIRSIHQPHHSKASSTSSASIGSPNVSVSSHRGVTRSPHSSVKVLPANPTSTTFPSNIRLIRSPPASLSLHPKSTTAAGEGSAAFGNSAFGSSVPPLSPGLPMVFAKRRRSLFKGPMVSLQGGSGSRRGSMHEAGRRRSGIIEEEEEDGDEEEVEEVDAFGPVVGPGEFVEEVEGDGRA